jgi:multiple antibiotic resistance protein
MKGEPFIVPLAIPLIAGPGLLATIMLYADMDTTETDMFFAILIATFASLGVLLIAPFLQKTLKTNGLLALEKLMGMILILMGVQRFTEGIKLFLTTLRIQ